MNFNLKFNHQWLLFFAMILFFSCQKEEVIVVDCPKFVDLGDFHLVDSSVDYMPYDETVQRIVFTDSLGNEFKAEVNSYKFGLGSILHLKEYPCEEDSMQMFQYTSMSESKHIEAVIEELDIKINLNLSVYVVRGELLNQNPDSLFMTDQINVTLRTPMTSTTPNTQLNIIVDSRNSTIASTAVPNSEVYTMHGVDFYDVYYLDTMIPSGKFNILYNAEKGLIGFENQDKSISLKYEYVE